MRGLTPNQGGTMTHKYRQYRLEDSPVEKARKDGPRGNGDWPVFDSVYTKISQACEKMAREPYVHLSDIHVETMADLGSGHEERMKYRLSWLRSYGWLS